MTTSSLVRAPSITEGSLPANAFAAPLTAAGREPGWVLEVTWVCNRMTGETEYRNG